MNPPLTAHGHTLPTITKELPKSEFWKSPMKTPLTLTAENYWPEIEATDLRPLVKGILKGLVHSHVTHTIPPTVSQKEKIVMITEGPQKIELWTKSDDRSGSKKETLTVMHFIPHDPKIFREFLYLAEIYPGGTNRPLAL